MEINGITEKQNCIINCFPYIKWDCNAPNVNFRCKHKTYDFIISAELFTLHKTTKLTITNQKPTRRSFHWWPTTKHTANARQCNFSNSRVKIRFDLERIGTKALPTIFASNRCTEQHTKNRGKSKYGKTFFSAWYPRWPL